MADGRNKNRSSGSGRQRESGGGRERTDRREPRGDDRGQGRTRSRADGGGQRSDARGQSRTRSRADSDGRRSDTRGQSGTRGREEVRGPRQDTQDKPGGKRAQGSSTDKRMRLNKAIASTGWCSRRQADELIEAGRVKVNGRVIREFSFLVDPYKDRLSIEGREVKHRKKEYIILYKPVGYLTTCDDERGRKTVLDILPETMQHLKPVGRLDRDSEGLLILTNDGDFAQRVTHPSQHVWKTYVAVVEGKVSQHNLAKLRGGIELSDGMTAPARVTDVSINPGESSFRISIREGKNRQIRRMCTEIGHPVIRLVRVAIGRLQLRSMEPFDWKYLSRVEVEKCCED